MSTRTRVAAAITGGVAVVAVLVAAPSVAANDPSGVVQPGPGNGPNQQSAQQTGVCDGRQPAGAMEWAGTAKAPACKAPACKAGARG